MEIRPTTDKELQAQHDPRYSMFWMVMAFWGVSAPKPGHEREARRQVAIIGGLIAAVTVAFIVGIVFLMTR